MVRTRSGKARVEVLNPVHSVVTCSRGWARGGVKGRRRAVALVRARAQDAEQV